MSLSWDRDAEANLKRVPFFMRKMVRNKVEERVKKRAGKRVTLSDFQEAEARFKNVTTGKSNEELLAMMPVENRMGVEMVVIETCHAELSNCQNRIIDPKKWKGIITEWIDKSGVSERLRKRIDSEKILYHHRFRVSISGCPNGCSRPQIADFAVVGAVSPVVDYDRCSSCGLCAEECPDLAIYFNDSNDGEIPLFDMSLCLGCYRCRDVCPSGSIAISDSTQRVFIGGKLGRRPHLADDVGKIKDGKGLVGFLTKVTDDFLDNSGPNERFSDFWIRSGWRNFL
jgi:dissimilatory sulfite reductase (desulfoviridin) alpha/beta subunit